MNDKILNNNSKKSVMEGLHGISKLQINKRVKIENGIFDISKITPKNTTNTNNIKPNNNNNNNNK